MNDKLYNLEVSLKATILLIEKYFGNTGADHTDSPLGDINLVGPTQPSNTMLRVIL